MVYYLIHSRHWRLAILNMMHTAERFPVGESCSHIRIMYFKFAFFSSRSRAHSSESIDSRIVPELAEHHPIVQPLQHTSTPSSTPQGTPHGTPSGFTVDGHSRKVKASSRRPQKQSADHISREKDDQSKLEPVKQVLFPIGPTVDPVMSSEEYIPSQLKKMPALISLTTSPTYTALSLNSTLTSAAPSSSTLTAGSAKKGSGGDVINLIPILSSTSISSSSGFMNAEGSVSHDAPPPLAVKAKPFKSNDIGGSVSKHPSQILPIGSNAGSNMGKLSAVSAISSSHTCSNSSTSFGPAHTQTAEVSVHTDTINTHHSKRLSRVLKSATAWAEENPPVLAHEIPVSDNKDSNPNSNLVQSTNACVDEVAQTNDRILQERLQEAKSLSRRNDCGAVMHSFSLWSKKGEDFSSITCNMKNIATTSTSVTDTVPSYSRSKSITESSIHVGTFSQTFPIPSTMNTRLRGPKARVREFQLLNGVQHESQLNQDEQEDLDANPSRSKRPPLDDIKSQAGHRGLPNLLRSKVGHSKKGGDDKHTKPDAMDLDGRDKNDLRVSKAQGSFASRYRRILQTQDDDSSSSNELDIPSFEPVAALNSTFPIPSAHWSKQQLHPIIYKGSLAFGASSPSDKDADMVVEDSVSVADEESVDIYEKNCYGNNTNTDSFGNKDVIDDHGEQEQEDDDILSEMSDNDDVNFNKNKNNNYTIDSNTRRNDGTVSYIEKDPKVYLSSKIQLIDSNVCNVNKKTENVAGDSPAAKKGSFTVCILRVSFVLTQSIMH